MLHYMPKYAQSDQAMLLVGQGKEPIALEMLNGVCVSFESLCAL